MVMVKELEVTLSGIRVLSDHLILMDSASRPYQRVDTTNDNEEI